MVQTLALTLDRSRWQPEVLCLDSRGDLAAPLVVAGIPVDVESRAPGFLDLRLMARLARRLGDHPPAILHTHGTTAMIYGAVAARMAGRVPVIATEHGRRGFVVGFHDRLLHEVTATLVDRHVAVSHDLRRELSWREKSRIVTIPNGIATPPSFDRASARLDLGFPAQSVIVGCVARLDAVKNHRLLLEAWRRARRRLPAGSLLLLVGDGPERVSLERWVAERIPDDSVRFLGTRPDAALIFAALDINVLSSHFEALSMTLLEASAAAVPSIATNVGGNREVVDDGRTGFLVAPGDPSMLADAILTLVRQPEEAARMGAAARRVFEERFTSDVMARRYEALYDECSARRAGVQSRERIALGH